MPDNTKTAVTRACRYDPDLNPTYQEFAVHYGMGVVPARPYKPRDKAKAESGVQVVERWIIAALRNQKFFSLPELNQAIRELLVRLNERPFRKRDGSRASLFHSLEKAALAPLPVERFDMSQWLRATVNIDYHRFDGRPSGAASKCWIAFRSPANFWRNSRLASVSRCGIPATEAGPRISLRSRTST